MAARSWRQRAACAGTDPALFYDPDPDAEHAAKQICAACPVRGPCAADAAARGEPHGIWGGLTEHERLTGSDDDHDRHRPGPAPMVSDDELLALFAAADPARLALDVILGAHRVAPATAYKYLLRARRLGVVEARGRNLHPARRPVDNR